MRIYIASSWRNKNQPSVVEQCRAAGHEVYDFRHPSEGDSGFSWSDIDPNWLNWGVGAFKNALMDPRAMDEFGKDMAALEDADAVILVLPCGRSAHLEAGWAAGAGKELRIFAPELPEPELMYRMAQGIHTNLGVLLDSLRRPSATELERDGLLKVIGAIAKKGGRDVINSMHPEQARRGELGAGDRGRALRLAREAMKTKGTTDA